MPCAARTFLFSHPEGQLQRQTVRLLSTCKVNQKCDKKRQTMEKWLVFLSFFCMKEFGLPQKHMKSVTLQSNLPIGAQPRFVVLGRDLQSP